MTQERSLYMSSSRICLDLQIFVCKCLVWMQHVMCMIGVLYYCCSNFTTGQDPEQPGGFRGLIKFPLPRRVASAAASNTKLNTIYSFAVCHSHIYICTMYIANPAIPTPPPQSISLYSSSRSNMGTFVSLCISPRQMKAIATADNLAWRTMYALLLSSFF